MIINLLTDPLILSKTKFIGMFVVAPFLYKYTHILVKKEVNLPHPVYMFSIQSHKSQEHNKVWI
jgi:hypothetical protein